MDSAADGTPQPTGKRDDRALARDFYDADGAIVKSNTARVRPDERHPGERRASVRASTSVGLDRRRIDYGRASRYMWHRPSTPDQWAVGLTDAIDNGEQRPPNIYDNIRHMDGRGFRYYGTHGFNQNGLGDPATPADAAYAAAHQYDTLVSPPRGPIGDSADGEDEPAQDLSTTAKIAIAGTIVLGALFVFALLVMFLGWTP